MEVTYMWDIKTCEDLHKQMWKYIKLNTTLDNDTPFHRHDCKRKFCISKNLDTSEHCCVLCKYAKSEEDKAFIAKVYSYSFVGLMLDWLKDDMKEDPEVLVGKFALVIQDTFKDALERFRTDKPLSKP